MSIDFNKYYEEPGQDCPNCDPAHNYGYRHRCTTLVRNRQTDEVVCEYCEHCQMTLDGPDPESLPNAAQILEVEDGRD